MLDEGWALVIAAAMTAVGAVLAVVLPSIKSFRQENREDHAKVMDVLEKVSNTVVRVEGKVDRHIEWHATGGSNGRTVQRDQGRISKAAKRK